MKVHPFLQPDGFIAFAHRGGANEATENTLSAFQSCVDLGYGYIETDAVATKDGKLLCFHDATLDRLTGQTGVIEQMPYSDIVSAKVDGEPIPLLEDVLANWPEIKFNIDPKNEGAVEGLLSAIKRTNSTSRVCVGSFDEGRLMRIRKAMNGAICTALGAKEVRRVFLAGYRIPAGNIIGACAQVPVKHGAVRVVTRRLIRTAERLGIRVHVWTVNQREEMEKLIDIGVHGIMTDCPSLLKSVLQERGIWTGH
jgi:glycerophosphoryl diester phosphodiesterase